MIKSRESTHWKAVSADMMSEEEPSGEEFIRHTPSWRSPFLNRFITKLEKRFLKKHEKSLAKPRRYGSPVKKPAPAGIPSWMKATACDGDRAPEDDKEVNDSGEELFDASDNSDSSEDESN